MISKTYQSKDITIVEENTKLPGVFIEYLMTKLQNFRNATMPAAQLNVCIFISGDRLYNFRVDISADGKNSHLTSVNNDPFTAIDCLLKDMKSFSKESN